MDPPPNTPVLKRSPPMPTTPHLSFARPVQPYTFEQLIEVSRNERFASPVEGEGCGGNDDGRGDGGMDTEVEEGHDTALDHKCESRASPEISPGRSFYCPPNSRSVSPSPTVILASSPLRAPQNVLSSSNEPATTSPPPRYSEPTLHSPRALSQQLDVAALEDYAGQLASANDADADADEDTLDDAEAARKRALKGKGKEKPDEAGDGNGGFYFGENSNMSVDSVRSTPCLATEGLERCTHHRSNAWGGHDNENRANQNFAVITEDLHGAQDDLPESSDTGRPLAWGIPERPQGGWTHNYHGAGTRYPRTPFPPHPRTPFPAHPRTPFPPSSWEEEGEQCDGEPVKQFEAQAAEAKEVWGAGAWGNKEEWPAGAWVYRKEWGAGAGGYIDTNTGNGWGADAEDGSVFGDNPQQYPGHVRSRHPSLVQNSAFDSPGAASTVRPFPRPQPPTEMHTHYHHHTYEPKPKEDSMDRQNRLLLKELRERNANQATLLGEQRIRIATLEKDLEHVKKIKEDAVNTSLFIVQNLGLASAAQGGASRRIVEGSGSSDRDDDKKFMLEVERLRKNNETFEALLNRSINHIEGGLSSKREKDKDVTASNVTQKCMDHAVESLEKLPKAKYGVPASHVNKQPAAGGLREAYEKDKALAALQKDAAESSKQPSRALKSFWNSGSETKGVRGLDGLFSSDATTAPNSPMFNPSSSSQAADTLQPVNKISDVGLRSLDDILAEDQYDYQPGAKTLKENVVGEYLPLKEETEPLSIQMERRMKEMSSFRNPAPSVLKVGFDISNAKLGAEYDHLAPQPVSETRRGGMNNYNRFDAAATANRYSNTAAQELWSSPEERESVINAYKRLVGRDGIRYPDIFRYGIQYVPEEDDENYFRTVTISNLPPSVSLREVLARVRGGVIASAILMDTKHLLRGTMSARVVFVEDVEACAFVSYTSTHPIVFGENGDARTAVITLVPTPTYPPSQGMIKRMKAERKDTRCLAIHNFPNELSLPKLQSDLACGNGWRADNLVETYLDEHNTLHLHFSNIQLAGSAFTILTKNWHTYRGLNVTFEEDPCAGLLEEMSMQLVPLDVHQMVVRGRPPVQQPGAMNNDNSSALSFQCRGNPQGMVGGEHLDKQREPLAGVENQKVVIPSFSGAGIQSSSWADEVIEESESSADVARINTSMQALKADDNKPESLRLDEILKPQSLEPDQKSNSKTLERDGHPNTKSFRLGEKSNLESPKPTQEPEPVLIRLDEISKDKSLKGRDTFKLKTLGADDPFKCDSLKPDGKSKAQSLPGNDTLITIVAENEKTGGAPLQDAPRPKSAVQILHEALVDNSHKSNIQILHEEFVETEDPPEALPPYVLPKTPAGGWPTRSASTDTFRGKSDNTQLTSTALERFNQAMDRKELEDEWWKNWPVRQIPAVSQEDIWIAEAKLDMAMNIPLLPKDLLEWKVRGSWYPSAGPIDSEYDPKVMRGMMAVSTRLRAASPATKLKYAAKIKDLSWPGWGETALKPRYVRPGHEKTYDWYSAEMKWDGEKWEKKRKLKMNPDEIDLENEDDPVRAIEEKYRGRSRKRE